MRTDIPAPETIDEYIAGFPPDIQDILQKIRALVKANVPEAEEAIKYQLPTFILKGNLVHFGAFKKHIGVYPSPTGIEKSALLHVRHRTTGAEFDLSIPDVAGERFKSQWLER